MVKNELIPDPAAFEWECEECGAAGFAPNSEPIRCRKEGCNKVIFPKPRMHSGPHGESSAEKKY